MYLLIPILNTKSDLDIVLSFRPKPSDPKSKTFFPSHLWFVKSFLAFESKELIQKFLVFRNFKAVFTLETLNIFKYYVPPLALL